jgi:hypothetical protein
MSLKIVNELAKEETLKMHPPGTIVQLLSGGPPMTVEGAFTDGDVSLIGFTHAGVFQRVRILPGLLRLVEPDPMKGGLR